MRGLKAAIVLAIPLAVTSLAAAGAGDVDAETAASMAWLEHWPTELERSDDPEHLLVGALVSQRGVPSPGAAAEFFRRALAGDPDNPLILHDVAAFCLLDPESEVCGPPYLRRLSELDSTNGAVWALRAWERHSAGDQPAALRYLRRAATAGDYDDYFLRHMTLFDQVLRAYQSASPAEHYAQVIGLAAGAATSGYRVMNACRERAAADAEWRHQCLALGRAMEQRSRTEMSFALGMSLQIAMLELADEPAALAAVQERLARTRAARYERAPTMESLTVDDPLWHAFFAAFVNQGETAAQELAAQKAAERLRDDAGD